MDGRVSGVVVVGGWTMVATSAVWWNAAGDGEWRTALLYDGGDAGRTSRCCCCWAGKGEIGVVKLAENSASDGEGGCCTDLLGGDKSGEEGEARDVSRAGMVAAELSRATMLVNGRKRVVRGEADRQSMSHSRHS